MLLEQTFEMMSQAKTYFIVSTIIVAPLVEDYIFRGMILFDSVIMTILLSLILSIIGFILISIYIRKLYHATEVECNKLQ